MTPPRLSHLPWLLAPALFGCVSLTQSAPEKQRYAWTASRPTREPPQPAGRVLVVRPATAAPGYGDRALVVRLTDQRFERDPYHELLVAPADALGDAARAWLAASGRFAAVVAPGSGVVPALRLELELRALHADLRDPKAPVSVVEIAWFLLEADRPRLLNQGTVQAQARAKDASGAALAAAHGEALAKALADLERALGE